MKKQVLLLSVSILATSMQANTPTDSATPSKSSSSLKPKMDVLLIKFIEKRLQNLPQDIDERIDALEKLLTLLENTEREYTARHGMNSAMQSSLEKLRTMIDQEIAATKKAAQMQHEN